MLPVGGLSPPGRADGELAVRLESIVGTWVSDPQPTRWGPMWLTFEIGVDDRLKIIGTPPDANWLYRREGPYRLDGDRLITSVLNEGEPVRVRAADGELVLVINDELWFRLRRD
jgi:hypothetical protein